MIQNAIRKARSEYGLLYLDLSKMVSKHGYTPQKAQEILRLDTPQKEARDVKIPLARVNSCQLLDLLYGPVSYTDCPITKCSPKYLSYVSTRDKLSCVTRNV